MARADDPQSLVLGHRARRQADREPVVEHELPRPALASRRGAFPLGSGRGRVPPAAQRLGPLPARAGRLPRHSPILPGTSLSPVAPPLLASEPAGLGHSVFAGGLPGPSRAATPRPGSLLMQICSISSSSSFSPCHLVIAVEFAPL